MPDVGAPGRRIRPPAERCLSSTPTLAVSASSAPTAPGQCRSSRALTNERQARPVPSAPGLPRPPRGSPPGSSSRTEPCTSFQGTAEHARRPIDQVVDGWRPAPRISRPAIPAPGASTRCTARDPLFDVFQIGHIVVTPVACRAAAGDRLPWISISRLLKSWAMPPASVPVRPRFSGPAAS